MTFKAITLSFLLLISATVSLGQDTIRYNGLLANTLLNESIELYPDSSFRWRSEYDLSWEEFGKYELKGNQLQLKYYLAFKQLVTMGIADSVRMIVKPFRITSYELSGEKMYRLNNKGKRVKKLKEKSVRTKWSWVFGHRHDFYYKKKVG